MAKQTLTFEHWKRIVDSVIESKVGLTSEDLPDYDYQRAWSDGINPLVVANRAIRAAKDF